MNLAKLPTTLPQYTRHFLKDSLKKKVFQRIEDGYSRSSIGFFHEKQEGFARQLYFEVLDLRINAIKNRFEQEDYKRYIILKNLLLKCVKNESFAGGLETVFNNYFKF